MPALSLGLWWPARAATDEQIAVAANTTMLAFERVHGSARWSSRVRRGSHFLERPIESVGADFCTEARLRDDAGRVMDGSGVAAFLAANTTSGACVIQISVGRTVEGAPNRVLLHGLLIDS